jgi:hypothetical protein
VRWHGATHASTILQRRVNAALTADRQVSNFRAVDTVPLKPERLAQLEDYARRRGKSTADALDDALADYLEWERQDYSRRSMPSARVTRT